MMLRLWLFPSKSKPSFPNVQVSDSSTTNTATTKSLTSIQQRPKEQTSSLYSSKILTSTARSIPTRSVYPSLSRIATRCIRLMSQSSQLMICGPSAAILEKSSARLQLLSFTPATLTFCSDSIGSSLDGFSRKAYQCYVPTLRSLSLRSAWPSLIFRKRTTLSLLLRSTVFLLTILRSWSNGSMC